MTAPGEPKCLIYELYSGVGFCNQLFSLETAIYLANISRRKLILLIRNPLCHCGRASWDYGKFLNFFTTDFLNYLPHGFDVYYNDVPQSLTNMISNTELTKKLVYPHRFSQLVFVDKELDTAANEADINNFCHHRTKTDLGFDEHRDSTYLYIDQSNASRCFYNFYTTPANYRLMYDICKSLRVKELFYDIASSIYDTLTTSKNNYNIFLHLRFGDYHKDTNFITRNNQTMLKNLVPYMDGHKTNLITPKVYLLCDNQKNTEFLNKIAKYKPVMIDTLSKKHFDDHFATNKMLFYDFHTVKNNAVNYAVIDMLLAAKSNEFIGTTTSTFSHYIQFLRYMNNKTFNKYLTITDGEYCMFSAHQNSKYDWIKYKYRGGHPVAWHVFWDINFNKSRTLMTIQGKTDGFGSQLQAMFSLIAYCYYKGYTYVHTPMYAMHHNDESIPNFPTYMNDFINIEHKFTTINQLSNYDKSIVHSCKEGPFVHGSYNPDYFYNTHILRLFREMYFSREKPALEYDKTRRNIAVHIRRGDVNSTKYPSRFTSNQQYIDLLKKMTLDNSTIYVFSEGAETDFQDIAAAFPDTPVVMRLNENIQTTFHHLVMADVLVLAKSSFSYCAGLLNENTKVANVLRSWWHKPLRAWTVL